ncbi:hypothetical protein H310_13493 [Aphanomyces invadans]|nr:hypothetical protein H310_13493 [Aphanomyces invadans]ETV92072.1 hypothetical protein H310_13493 [Aphanomyces invadans]|eukprot:XP_008879234.1 hypothetical protein H310_13493 [Aphanomyces invadans]
MTTHAVVRSYSAPVQSAEAAPYMCQLRSMSIEPMKCQGVLVDTHAALFTRRCMAYFEKGDKVVVGPARVDGGLDDGDWIPVVWISIHETLDFAMALLDRPAKVAPVGILWDDLKPGAIATMRGWNPFNGDNASKIVLETSVQIMTNDQCTAKFNHSIANEVVCGDNDWFPDCASYVFGSLFANIGGNDFLVGIQSGFWCNSRPAFQIFSRLSAGRGFIEQFLCLAK